MVVSIYLAVIATAGEDSVYPVRTALAVWVEVQEHQRIGEVSAMQKQQMGSALIFSTRPAWVELVAAPAVRAAVGPSIALAVLSQIHPSERP